LDHASSGDSVFSSDSGRFSDDQQQDDDEEEEEDDSPRPRPLRILENEEEDNRFTVNMMDELVVLKVEKFTMPQCETMPMLSRRKPLSKQAKRCITFSRCVDLLTLDTD
jgi:hypothetical protein